MQTIIIRDEKTGKTVTIPGVDKEKAYNIANALLHKGSENKPATIKL